MPKDILSDLGNKSNSVDGAGKASEPQQATGNTATITSEMGRGDDLLSKLGGKKSQTSTAETKTTAISSAESGQTPTSASSTEEPTGGQSDSSSWTAESALKEVKKLREENKAYRIKYQEQLDKIKAENEARELTRKQEVEALKQSKQELDRIKADQEDKKRDLSEKLAHREARLAEMQALHEAKEAELKRILSEQENIVRRYEADRQAESQVYQSRVDEELNKIPAKYQDYAKLLVKGAGDPREALVAISEARIRGMFDDKTIVVNHSVPGAGEGARANQERLEEANKARREKMNSSQKIGEALKSIKSGNPNSVFRTK